MRRLVLGFGLLVGILAAWSVSVGRAGCKPRSETIAEIIRGVPWLYRDSVGQFRNKLGESSKTQTLTSIRLFVKPRGAIPRMLLL